MTRRRVVRLEEEAAQSSAELRQPQPLVALGAEDDADRVADVVLAGRPDDAAVRADAGRERDAAAEDRPGIHHFAFNPIGKQMRRNGIHQNTMLSRLMKIISTISAQMVMIGIENEQMSPRSRLCPSANFPSSASFRF